MNGRTIRGKQAKAVQPERLSLETPKGEAIVCTRRRLREGDPKRSPRHRRVVTKVTDFWDNPTEVTRFDVDQVVQTLMSNNAYTISDHIEGKQFLALAKFLLIDLEGYGNAKAA